MEGVDQAKETLMPKTIVLVATLDTQGKVLLPLTLQKCQVASLLVCVPFCP